MIMFITVCAIIVVGIAVAVVVDRIMRTHDTQNDGSYWGCKYLDFGMMILHYARKALMVSVFRTDSSTGKEE